MTRQQTCPDADSLKNLLQGDLPAEEQALLTGHLDTCLDCRQTLELLAGEDIRVVGPIVPLVQTEPISGSAFHRAIEDLKRDSTETATLLGAASNVDSVLDLLAPAENLECLGKFGCYEILEIIGRGAWVWF